MFQQAHYAACVASPCAAYAALVRLHWRAQLNVTFVATSTAAPVRIAPRRSRLSSPLRPSTASCRSWSKCCSLARSGGQRGWILWLLELASAVELHAGCCWRRRLAAACTAVAVAAHQLSLLRGVKLSAVFLVPYLLLLFCLFSVLQDGAVFKYCTGGNPASTPWRIFGKEGECQHQYC